jgi:riboflavin kinase / FMN adenylyltransferase
MVFLASLLNRTFVFVNIFNHLDEFISKKNAVVTTGTFDGVHRGHQQIIKRLKDTAQKVNGETVLLTFFPHPRMVLFPEQKQLLLNSLHEKKELLSQAGIDNLIIHPFTREFSMLGSSDFIQKILVQQLGTIKLVIGYDHHFGRNREGSFEHLKEFGPVYGFEIEEIPAWEVENMSVSSTKIRQSLESGEVSTAATLLGYRYMLTGNVVKGKQLGRTIGFPTANMVINDPYKLVPADGVYAVKVHCRGKTWNGMLNIGMRPTVNGLNKTIEVNILDFDADIYGETLTLDFVKRLRNEQKFDGLEALKQQLNLDRLSAKAVLEHET